MVRRPLVAALRSSPSLIAALFQEWPLGVIRPRRNSLVWASASDGANSGTAALAARKRRRERDMTRLLEGLDLLDEDEGEGWIEREQHQKDAGDAEQRQRHHEHLAGLGAGDGGGDEEAKTDRG